MAKEKVEHSRAVIADESRKTKRLRGFVGLPMSLTKNQQQEEK
jgi:hypothetical protein